MNDWLLNFYTEQAHLGFNEGDFTRVRNSCERVLAQRPKSTECWALLGEAALASKDSATAMKAYEHLIELESTNSQHFIQLGKTYLQLQAWPACALVLRQALKLEPDNAQASEMLGLVERMQAALLHQEALLPASGEVGRNDPCPCGSGLKYKKCCLANNTQSALRERFKEALQAEDWLQVESLSHEIDSQEPTLCQARGVALYHLGRLAEARTELEVVQSAGRLEHEANWILADCLLEHDLVQRAEPLVRRFLSVEPKRAEARRVLARCFMKQGRYEAAETELRHALLDEPSCSSAWDLLAELLCSSGRAEESLACNEQAVQQNSSNARAWYNLGNARMNQGFPSTQIRECFERSLQLKPDSHESLNNLGNTYFGDGMYDHAQTCLVHALKLKPDYALAWSNLGSLYIFLGRLPDATGCLKRAVAIDPNYADAWSSLAHSYLDQRRFQDAEYCMREALALRPDVANYWNNLGNALIGMGKTSRAIEYYQKALELDSGQKEAASNLGNALTNFVKIDEALIHYRRLLADYPIARPNFLFALNYHPDMTAQQIYTEYRNITDSFYPPRKYFDYQVERKVNRKLRVGYCSPDFRNHSCYYFIAPLLENHDRSRVELVAYSDVRDQDYITDQLRGQFDEWYDVVGMSDAALAEKIHTDRIDILVDMAGHTSGNRLSAFALKPAPVQASWMGYGYTTGLSQVDYFLTEAEVVPLGHESVFAERIWRMDTPAYAYQPNKAAPQVSPLPALRNGYITFGTLTRSVRVNYKVVRAWAAILNQVPGSRLILNSSTFNDEAIQQHYIAQFAEHGVSADRLEMGFETPPWEPLAQMDIGLDCFPHNSGTTLFESLWLGVPYITLRDRPSMGRLGSSILKGVGHLEWAADSEAEYVAKAVVLAGDIRALADIRGRLRGEMAASPVCDGASFAERLEQAYAQMWKRYCESGEQA